MLKPGVEVFVQMLERKSVAIVGNAATAMWFDQAQLIDGADVVVRFNRFRVGSGYSAVGTKTDVIAVPLGCSEAIPDQETLQRYPEALILAVCPKEGDDPRHGEGLVRDHRLAYLPNQWFDELQCALGCRPTTGLATVAFALEHCSPKSLYLTGLSFQKLSKGHYFSGSTFHYQIHDPLKELHYYARIHRPEVVETDAHIRKRLYGGQPSYEYRELRRRGGKEYSVPHRWLYEQVSKDVAGLSVLEVGAGIGYGCRVLRKAGAARIVAVEPETESYSYLLSLGTYTEAHNVPLDGFESEEIFDIATCIEVAEHLPPVEVHPFLSRLRKRCRRLYLSSPDRRCHGHGVRTPYEWQLALSAAGFKCSDVRQNAWATLLIAN